MKKQKSTLTHTPTPTTAKKTHWSMDQVIDFLPQPLTLFRSPTPMHTPNTSPTHVCQVSTAPPNMAYISTPNVDKRTHWSMDLVIVFLLRRTASSCCAALTLFCLLRWARVSFPEAGVGLPSDNPPPPSASSSSEDSESCFIFLCVFDVGFGFYCRRGVAPAWQGDWVVKKRE